MSADADEDKPIFPAGAPLELLTLAREKAVTLLNRLLSEQAEAEWDPARFNKGGDPEAAAGWRHAMTCAIESAKRAVAAIEAAMKVAMKVAPGAPEAPPPPAEQDGHHWN